MSTVRIGRRRSAILPTLVIVAALVVIFAIFTSIWTDRLWYRSFDYGAVFSKMLLTRIGLFAAFGLIMATCVVANAAIAFRLRPRLGAPSGSPILERYRDLLESRFVVITVIVGVLVGLFAGGSASSRVFDYLAWRNASPFNVDDPQFGIDVSFFVFGYPWWRFTLSFAFAVLGLSVVAAAIVHYTMGGLRLSGPRRGGTPAAQAHLSILIGLAVIVKGVGYWFDQYGQEIVDRPGILMTGITYTADHATITAKMILAIIAGLCALLFFANALLRRWVVPTIGLILLLLSAIVLGLVYPGAVQYFSVKPSERLRETPYIAKHIAATRAAYAVDKVEISDYSAKTTASAGQLKADAEALPGIRLIDPNVVSPAFDQLQQVRGYYSFPNTLDVDRYTIDGKETDAVVAVREMDLKGVTGANWNNLKTVYTHGFGLVAAYGNRRQSGGEPEWIVKDIPPTGLIEEHEPRIYFGENLGSLANQYSMVGAPPGVAPVELDTPGGGEGGNPKTYTYTGKGGVPIGNLWNRLLYAAKFADVNLLLSEQVNSASKIIYDRTPRERVQAVAPWLKVDGDAYPAVVEGRIVWIVDGYTTSNSYPNSKRVNLRDVTSDALTNTPGGAVVAQPRDDINYIRNSVKAVVDAYDGTVKMYAWDEADPVLQTWQKAFPNVVAPKAAIPQDLLDHLRYPQDLFKVQREIIARYHMTDPANWYQNSSLWDVPNNPVGTATQSKESPAYLSVKWPTDDGAIFSLTSAYVPRGRSNLAAYMAVNADASSPDYGRMRILQMSDTTQIDGPGQAFSAMTQNETVSSRLRPFLNQGSASATFGNLLTLPLGSGLLYVTPVYIQRQGTTGAYPALQFVVIRFGQQVGIGDTLQDALDQVFKGDSGAKTDEGGTSNEPTGKADNPAAAKALEEAEAAFADADRALAAQDLAGYQAKLKEAEGAVRRARIALGR